MKCKINPDVAKRLEGCSSCHFSTAQTLDLLGVGQTKFYKDLKEGKLKISFVMGKKRYIKGIDILAYAEQITRENLTND